MHLLVRRDATLADLDAFLRRAWLECCGHLSQFTIERQRFSVHPDPDLGWFGGPKERNMKVALGEVLAPGMRFSYEYDFGSTTELALQVLDEWAAHPVRGKVQLLALNNPPESPCSVCGEPASLIDLEADPEEALLCAACAKQRHLKDMVLPLLNSPRFGACGYTGPPLRIPARKGAVTARRPQRATAPARRTGP